MLGGDNMPNGGYYTKEEWQKIEAFFESISQTLNKFAQEHNLHIEKYYHEGQDWTFQFSHPLGGVGQIQVMKREGDLLCLGHHWYKDDYDALTRYSKHEIWKNIPIDQTELKAALEKALKTILYGKLGEWTSVSGNRWSLFNLWHPWKQFKNKEEFENATPKFPKPVV